jgi:hypothetical protein
VLWLARRVIVMKNVLAVAATLICLSGAAAAQSGDGYDRTVYVINNTSGMLVDFYASNVGEASWQEDLLGSRVVRSGDAVEANIDDGTRSCEFDFMAVFSDGSTATEWRFNVCRETAWTIYD